MKKQKFCTRCGHKMVERTRNKREYGVFSDYNAHDANTGEPVMERYLTCSRFWNLDHDEIVL